MAKTILEVDNQKIAIDDYGDQNGKVLVINHGMIASIYDESLFDMLINLGYRIVAAARPGYGKSSVFQLKNIAEWGEITEKILDQLGISTCSVFGISSGAPYAYALGQRSLKVRNIYILSGIPALYMEEIQQNWPFPVNNETKLEELQQIAKDIFFGNGYQLNSADQNMTDSYKNNCYGIALDLYLRTKDWGFLVNDIRQNVFMEHTQDDASVPFICAEQTRKQIKNCTFIKKVSGGHFSEALLNDFIANVVNIEELRVA